MKIDAEHIIKAVLNPFTMSIRLKKISGPLKFEGAGAYGISHEMEHLFTEETGKKFLWDFKYVLEND